MIQWEKIKKEEPTTHSKFQTRYININFLAMNVERSKRYRVLKVWPPKKCNIERLEKISIIAHENLFVCSKAIHTNSNFWHFPKLGFNRNTVILFDCWNLTQCQYYYKTKHPLFDLSHNCKLTNDQIPRFFGSSSQSSIFDFTQIDFSWLSQFL